MKEGKIRKSLRKQKWTGNPNYGSAIENIVMSYGIHVIIECNSSHRYGCRGYKWQKKIVNDMIKIP